MNIDPIIMQYFDYTHSLLPTKITCFNCGGPAEGDTRGYSYCVGTKDIRYNICCKAIIPCTKFIIANTWSIDQIPHEFYVRVKNINLRLYFHSNQIIFDLGDGIVNHVYNKHITFPNSNFSNLENIVSKVQKLIPFS